MKRYTNLTKETTESTPINNGIYKSNIYPHLIDANKTSNEFDIGYNKKYFTKSIDRAISTTAAEDRVNRMYDAL